MSVESSKSRLLTPLWEQVKMDVAGFSETLTTTYQTARCYDTEHQNSECQHRVQIIIQYCWTFWTVTTLAMCVQHNIETGSYNHCCSGKATRTAYFECVFVALLIQHVIHILHIVICGLPHPTLEFFNIFKKYDFRKKVLLNTKYVFWFSLQLLCGTFLILRRTGRDMVTNF